MVISNRGTNAVKMAALVTCNSISLWYAAEEAALVSTPAIITV